jgi:hypothetical protein
LRVWAAWAAAGSEAAAAEASVVLAAADSEAEALRALGKAREYRCVETRIAAGDPSS